MSDMINDFACLEPLYVDGIVSEAVVNLGTNFATPYFRWSPTMREGRIMLERVPALYVIRPIASLDPRDPLLSLLQKQMPPAEAAAMMEAATSFKH
jgi:hypothetical protein